ncbi:hypothetical protein AGDE_02394 [Angomonas deanei]|nr:hypothetical protein AGDE_02394 [Angomonas deanei]|eukprot:EPY41530.1 hypothetical protein AGDE_02394 [Angomonas deanei]
MAQHWEKAFFGRVHYEEGMHERYKGALDAEEEERYFDHESQGNIIDLCKKKIPSWDETEKVPQALFLARLAPNEQLQYIIYKLTFAQRRIRYAADYGGSSMMLQLQLGETALTEAEELLTKLDWMNDELQEKIEELKLDANTVKFEYDLD